MVDDLGDERDNRRSLEPVIESSDRVARRPADEVREIGDALDDVRRYRLEASEAPRDVVSLGLPRRPEVMESDRALRQRPGLDPCRIVRDDEGSDVPSLRIDTTRLLIVRRLNSRVAEEDESGRNGRRHDYGKSHD